MGVLSDLDISAKIITLQFFARAKCMIRTFATSALCGAAAPVVRVIFVGRLRLYTAEDNSGRVDHNVLGAVVRFIDANQAIGQLEHVVTQRDDDKLCVLRALLYIFMLQLYIYCTNCAHLDIVRQNGDVAEVERRINLVHDVQWRRFVVVQGEHK